MARVGLARGNQSYQAVRRALDLIRSDVQVPRDRPVLIKTNMVSSTVELAATPVDAVRATLDFLTELGVKKSIIAEGTAVPEGDTMGAFQRFGYMSLADHYDVEFRNLHDDEHVEFEALDGDLMPITIRLARSMFESYLVSVARMKTHLEAIVTMTIKNIGVGAIYNPDRHSSSLHNPEPGKFSHGQRPLNLYLARLNLALTPALAVVDGVVGMEGKGPVAGTPVASGVALAGTNALAVDILGSELMGFDYRTVGYLWYLSQMRGLAREDVQVVGEDPTKCVTRYKPYENMPELLSWWVADWRERLSGNYLKKRTALSR
ncbi:MAG: DUF362 domain-containing protein [Chloroflexota bacterium]|nr:DUF362 domain-containing protein [Chloroflexota bacterium]